MKILLFINLFLLSLPVFSGVVPQQPTGQEEVNLGELIVSWIVFIISVYIILKLTITGGGKK